MCRNIFWFLYCFVFIVALTPQSVQAGKDNILASRETYTFEREISLAPDEFYAVTYDNELKSFVEYEPDKRYQCLPDRALKQILRAPIWLREKFADRLVDIYYDDIDVGENAVPFFKDINNDGLRDLLIGNATGKPRYFLAPYFNEDKNYNFSNVEYFNAPSNVAQGEGFYITGADDGSLKATPTGSVDNQLLENLNRIEVSGKSYPVFEDVTGDNLPDLLIGSSDGTISVYRNYGTKTKWWFVSYTPKTDRKFDYDVGFMSSPCIADFNDDGINDIISGSKNSPIPVIYPGPEYTEKMVIPEDLFPVKMTGGSVPACGDFNSDGVSDLVLGLESGDVYVFLADNGASSVKGQKSFNQKYMLKVQSFATPYAGDFDGDSIDDLVIGSGDGKIHFFKGAKNGFKEVDGFFGEIKLGEYPSPTGYDYNNDGKTDLVVGNKAGEIKVFIAPNWTEVDGGLGLVSVGSYSSPAFGDLTQDGIPELLIGVLDGTFHYYEGKANKWTENYSWKFHPERGIATVEDYFNRTHPESTLFRGAIDDETLNSYIDVLEKCGDEYFDEAAFTIANTQTEILRVMNRLGNADLVFENAKAIYDFASKVKYAKIKEKGDYTTIEYVSEDGTLKEMPRDIYYWWVVHPVIEYEFPARVDASYWRHDSKYYGIPEEEWTRKGISVEEYEHTANAFFWRTFLPIDNRYGKNLIDVVEKAENIKEAAYLIADWITYSGSKPGRWNEYGMASDDLQPLVIYEKNYGSCGEQAIMGAAFSRTALIPNAPVGCYGEDHAWNEYWMDGNWYKWDLSNDVVNLGQPWNEGRGHTGTPLLSIARRWGDGVTDNSTTRPINPPGANYNPRNAPGYSSVGRVKIRVVDEINEPIEGALIVVRSKWNNNFRASIWDYTDPEGYCYFELGNPITGSCVVDIITPLGATGTECFVVRENENFEYTYKLNGRFNRQILKYNPEFSNTSGVGNIKVSTSVIEEEQRPCNYAGGRRGRFSDTKLYEKTGFYGTRWYSEPNCYNYGVYSAKLSRLEYEQFLETKEIPPAGWIKNAKYSEPFSPDSGDVYVFYNANRYTHVRLKTSITAELEPENPRIELASAPKSAKTGEKVTFTGAASDNLNVDKLKFSCNGGNDFADITECYNCVTKEFEYTWDTSAGGPMPAGEYKIIFRVEDCDNGFIQTQPIEFALDAAKEFKDQVIYQDNPDTPLPTCSWMLGPFIVGENERFLGIEGYSVEPEFDMDMFLFHDNNGNRKIDGDSEQIAKAAGATAIETIILNDPPPGAYWIYCQGWQVKDRTDIDPWKGVRDLSPGKLLTLPTSDVKKKTAYALLDVSLSFNYKPAFIVDINPYKELLISEPLFTGKFQKGFDVDPKTLKVTFAGKDISQLAQIEKSQFRIPLDSINIQVGNEYPLRIEAKTTDGFTDSIELTLTATKPEISEAKQPVDQGKKQNEPLIKLHPRNEEEVFDFKSVLIAYFELEIRDKVAEVDILLDNKNITESCTIYTDGVIYIPHDLYMKGEHTFKVIVTLKDGHVVEGTSVFRIMSMDDKD